MLDSRGQDDRSRVAQLYHVRVRDPVRRRDYRLAAVFQHRHAKIEQSLLCPGADADLCRRELKTIFTGKLALHGLLEAGKTGNRRVLGCAVPDCSNGRFLDGLRGIKIRFAGAKANNIAPRSAQFGRQRQRRAGRRGLNPCHAI